MKKLLRYLSLLTFFLIFFMFGVSLFWTFYPQQVMSWSYQPWTILNENKEVKRGDIVKWQVSLFNYTDKKTCSVGRVIHGATLTFLADAPYTTKYGQDDFPNATVVIPQSLDLGEYYIVNTLTCKVSPFRDVVVIAETEPFTVIK